MHRENCRSLAGFATDKVVVENNALANHTEKTVIDRLAKEGVATKQELDAAACALLKCSAEFAEGTAEKAYYENLEKTGSQPEYAALREQLANEKFVVSYKDPLTGENVTISTALFQYTNVNAILDGATYANGEYQLTTRGAGLLQAAVGAAEMIGGGASCAGIVTCAAGIIVATSGYDNLQAGSETLATGKPTKTVGAGLLETLGVPPQYSEVVYSGVSIFGTTTLMLKSARTGEVISVGVSKDGLVTRDIIDDIATSTKPEWLQNVQAGNKFNAEQSVHYPYNEVYVNKPGGSGYYRVDSYNPTKGEIVSRKFTQFSDITEKTAKDYIREAVNKYPAGATIAKVPSSGSLAGKKLQGSNILEVPPQIKPIPQSVIDAANSSGIIIRDTNGKIY